jgi:hypothetical protein
MPNVWTINAGDVTGGNTKTDLVGCHITTNDDDTAYEFTDNNINTVLATTPGTSLPTPPFTFPEFDLDGYTWTITVNTLTGGAGGNRAAGDWSNNAPTITAAEEGTYTAQAGGGAEEDIPAKEDSASASA